MVIGNSNSHHRRPAVRRRRLGRSIQSTTKSCGTLLYNLLAASCRSPSRVGSDAPVTPEMQQAVVLHERGGPYRNGASNVLYSEHASLFRTR
jgi:hypothetical protein